MRKRNKMEELEQKVENLVWMAWSNGSMSGHPMTSPRKEDELHREVWMELKEVREMIETLSK